MARWSGERAWPVLASRWVQARTAIVLGWGAVGAVWLLLFASGTDIPDAAGWALLLAVAAASLLPLFRLWHAASATKDALDQAMLRSDHPVG
jgi:hypothetical protein